MPIEDKVSEDLNRVLLRLKEIPRKSIREGLMWQTMEWLGAQLGYEIEKR